MTEERKDESSQTSFVKGLSLCTVYILISAALIDFNKYLMNPRRFPHAMALTWMHMALSWGLCLLLYALKPNLYPSMANTEGKRLTLLKWFLPLGALFAVGLYASNQAYMYCSVAFLQFMKEANIVLVFLLSCLIGLQVVNRVRMVVILWIIAGSAMAVHGEVRFVLIGFVIQAISQFAECGKNVMGEYILSGSNMKLDPLTYTMFMAPVCLGVLTVGNVFTWDSEIIPRVMVWWPYLLPNACLAFCLNVTIAVLIKECSAMGFILSGLVKDMFIVSVSSMMFGDIITAQQIVGFTICLAGIFYWSFMRIAPQSSLVIWMNRLLGMPEEENSGIVKLGKEAVPLIQKTANNKV